MFLSNVVLVSCFISLSNSARDKVMLKFKSDVDKVGKDLGNLVFDIVKEVVDDVGAYRDYYGSEEGATEHSVTKKILDDIENTTEEYSTEKTIKHVFAFENSTNYEEILHNRLKRSLQDNSSIPLNQSNEAEAVTETPITNDTCCTKSGNEEIPQFHQMDDLKEEVKKLHDLVMLLKDQQKIISLLDKNSKSFESDISSRFGAKNVLNLLDFVNNKDVQDQKENHFPSSVHNTDLLNLKNDLKEAIATLNKTKHILTMERKKELLLEKELSEQKLDISFLKMMMEKIYKNNREDLSNDILGAPQHLPKELPDRHQARAVSVGNARKNEIEEPSLNIDQDASSNELDDIERLLRKLNQPKKPDIESRISEIERELERKQQNENVLKQLKLFHKYLERQKKSGNDQEMNRRFHLPTKTMDKGKNRELDEQIELELEKLQDAIDKLRPSDDTDPTEQSDGEAKQFEMMLKKLFNQQNYRKEGESKRSQMTMDKMYYKEGNRKMDAVDRFQAMLDKRSNQDADLNGPVNREQSLLLREIVELRKQLASSGNSQFGGGYNYGSADIFGQKPRQMEWTTSGFGNLRPNYSPYPEYQNVKNQLLSSGSSNQHLPNQLSADYIKPNIPNFLPTYYKSLPEEYNKPYGRPLNQDNQYGFEQNPLESNKFSMGSPFEPYRYQNLPEQTKVFSPPLYKYKSEPNTEFQPLVDQREIPFTISILPSHKAFNLEANSVNNAYPNDQTSFRQDSNQFFLNPQRDFNQKPPPEFFRPSTGPLGVNTGQPGGYPPKTANNMNPVQQSVDDLRAQVYNLQNAIDGLNKPNHTTQTLQETETVVGLKKQIGNLKGAIDGMNPNYAPSPPLAGHDLPKPRRRKSIEDNEIEDSQLYDQVSSGLKKLIFEKGDITEGRNTYENLQRRIDDLRYQLDNVIGSKDGIYSPILSTSINQPPYYLHNHFIGTAPKFTVTTSKRDDIFTSIVVKIVEKIIASTPAVLERLFGRGLTELSNFGDASDNPDGGQSDVQKLFKSLGFFGYGPLIFLRIVDGFTTFVKILRKNDFFKNFLTPVLVLLLVAGAVIFLVWWLQPNEDFTGLKPSDSQSSSYNDKYYGPYSNYNYRGGGYGNNDNNYGYGGSYRPAVYSRSYFHRSE